MSFAAAAAESVPLTLPEEKTVVASQEVQLAEKMILLLLQQQHPLPFALNSLPLLLRPLKMIELLREPRL